MLGIGLGLLVALLHLYQRISGIYQLQKLDVERQASIVYGACVLLFGGGTTDSLSSLK